VSPAVFPLGVRSSPESCELRLRPLVPSPVKPLQEGAGSFQDRAGPPLMGFLLPRTQLRRVPLLRRALPCSRTRGTRIARPSSVPSSGFLPLSTVPAVSRLARGLLDPAVRRGPQRFAAFFHAARVPGTSPPELSLPGEPYPLSRAFCFLAGFTVRLSPAWRLQGLRDHFPDPRQFFAARARPKADPGLMNRDVRSSWPLVRSHSTRTRRAARAVLSPPASWLAWFTAGVPASKPCSPRESVLRQPQYLARLRPPVGALLGFFPFRAFSTPVRGPVTRVDTRRGLRAPIHVRHRAPSHRGCIPRPGLRRLGSRAQDPPIHRVSRTPRITVRQRPSSPRASRALCSAPVASPIPTPCRACFGTERLARAPSRRHPAPPCPSPPSPPKGRQRLDLEDALTSNRAPVPPLARRAGDRAPCGTRSGPPSPGRPPLD